MAYFCSFSFGENVDFPDFPQKSFITSTTGQLHTQRMQNSVSMNRKSEYNCCGPFKNWDRPEIIKLAMLLRTCCQLLATTIISGFWKVRLQIVT